MPWTSPTLEQLRALNRDNVQSQLRSGPMIPNSVLRVMSDSNAGLAYLVILYLNWISQQLLPDTQEESWLDRSANIWRPGGSARKAATFGNGTVNMTATVASVSLPAGTLLSCQLTSTSGTVNVTLQSSQAVVLGITPTTVPVVSLVAGQTGLQVGNTVSLVSGVANVISTGTVASYTDGVNQESDDQLRPRVLSRIQQPPVGGDAQDYVQWTSATPGVNVTRAWCSPLEMGAGTVTIRFMTDDLINRVVGFASASNIQAVRSYLDTVRPVTTKDRFVETCIPEPINFTISNLSPDTVANRNAIAAAVTNMLFEQAAPAHAINGIEQEAQTIYREWVSGAISNIGSIDSFTLIMSDHPMPTAGSLGVLGTVVYG